VQVQVGLTNDTQSEITGGQLKDGDTIVLNATTAASTTGGRSGRLATFGATRTVVVCATVTARSVHASRYLA